MSRSSGSGHPLTLRCSHCKWRSYAGMTYKGTNLSATGRHKPVKKWTSGGIRQGALLVEYQCKDCGHVGWSKHIDANRLFFSLNPLGQ